MNTPPTNKPQSPVTRGLVWWTEQASVTGHVPTDVNETVVASDATCFAKKHVLNVEYSILAGLYPVYFKKKKRIKKDFIPIP